MLAFIFVVGLLASHAAAETIQCIQGQQACSGHSQLSIINNHVSCCRDEFSMHWTTDQLTGTPTCYCNRMYYESDCLQGPTQCQNATSVTGDGRCCHHGDSMSVISNAIINGVRVDSCKCRRFNTVIAHNGISRVMTPAEQAQFRAEMSRWSQNFQQQMGTLAQNLQTSLGSLGTIFGQRMTPVARRTSLRDIGDLTTGFIDGLSRSFSRPPVDPRLRNMAASAPAPSPTTGGTTPRQAGGASPTQAPNMTREEAARAAAIAVRNRAELARRHQAEMAARNQALAQQNQAAMAALFGMNAEVMEQMQADMQTTMQQHLQQHLGLAPRPQQRQQGPGAGRRVLNFLQGLVHTPLVQTMFQPAFWQGVSDMFGSNSTATPTTNTNTNAVPDNSGTNIYNTPNNTPTVAATV